MSDDDSKPQNNDVLILMRAVRDPERGGYSFRDHPAVIGKHRAVELGPDEAFSTEELEAIGQAIFQALRGAGRGVLAALQTGRSEVQVDVRLPPAAERILVWSGGSTRPDVLEGPPPCPSCGQVGSVARSLDGQLQPHRSTEGFPCPWTGPDEPPQA